MKNNEKLDNMKMKDIDIYKLLCYFTKKNKDKINQLYKNFYNDSIYLFFNEIIKNYYTELYFSLFYIYNLFDLEQINECLCFCII